MRTATFLGTVQGGLIQTGEPLAEFEGKQVYVTLRDAESPPTIRSRDSSSSPPAELEDGAELLADLGRIRVPPRDSTSIELEIRDIGRKPRRTYCSDEES